MNDIGHDEARKVILRRLIVPQQVSEGRAHANARPLFERRVG
jgi:hypothetical protein